ncbi:MAG: hypothetical protein AAF443_07980 [Chlamydiota bacterium]
MTHLTFGFLKARSQELFAKSLNFYCKTSTRDSQKKARLFKKIFSFYSNYWQKNRIQFWQTYEMYPSFCLYGRKRNFSSYRNNSSYFSTSMLASIVFTQNNEEEELVVDKNQLNISRESLEKIAKVFKVDVKDKASLQERCFEAVLKACKEKKWKKFLL